MAPKRRPHKRCKRSILMRKTLAALKEKKIAHETSVSGDLLDTTSTTIEESSEQVFNNLLEETRLNSVTENGTDEELDKEPIWEDEKTNDSEYFPPLLVEKSLEPEEIDISGRRIVNINHLLKELQIVANHKNVCTMGSYKYQHEIVSGLFSKFIYYCDNCEKQYVVTSDPVTTKDECNDALVWGALNIGIGHSQIQDLFSVMDVPVMGHPKFRAHERKIGKVWEETLYCKMKETAEEERRIAIEKGNFLNGVPYITVIGDGGWAKRSYGHGMNSTGGVGVLIGAETKKLLFLGVRNKFCYICTKHKNKNEDPPDHDCFKNYNGPSTGMETSVIVEGFRRSEEDYGLVYKFYIGDGDSSVYARIQESCKYGRYVQKVECANHITRALNDHLHKLAENTKFPIESRKLLTSPSMGEHIPRLERITKGVRTAIKEAGTTKSAGDLENLRHDLKNAVDHVFGQHDRCRISFCKRKENDSNLLTQLDPDFLAEIRRLLGKLESKAESLVLNETTNRAEQYMSLVAKFTGGKRVNYCSRGSYRRRCIGAGLSHSAGPKWQLSPWRKLQNKSPGKVLKCHLSSREKMRSKRSLLFSTNGPQKKKIRRGGSYDLEYGPLAIEPDLAEEDLQKKMEEQLEILNKEVDHREEIERKTVGQHNNSVWKEFRMNRLTASNFGKVVKRLEYTSCHNLVKTILYSKDVNTSAILFGRVHEKDAIEEYEKLAKVSVQPCGFFVFEEGYLGASPDGLVGDEGIVEVKCLPSVKGPLNEFVRENRNTCLEMGGIGELKLKKKHNYFFQVQGQLNITNRKWCDFVVYTRSRELFIERIEVDHDLWKNTMLPKLSLFYKECMLPEIVDSRINRQLRVRDPPYIVDAQSKREEKKSKKC